VDGEKWQGVGWCALGMRGCGWGKMVEGGMVCTGYERLWMGKNGKGWDGAHWV